MNILITGSSGFVGAALANEIRDEPNTNVILVSRSQTYSSKLSKKIAEGKQLANETDWSDVLNQCDVVIHCAARVHVMNDVAVDPLQEFRAVNLSGTLQLGRQAAKAGVKRFVFISSIKVNGEGTEPGVPYTAFDAPAPHDPYGISKYEAEEGLKALAAEYNMELVIIRPVLVYGPGVKANFRSMMEWLSKGVPLPLGSIHNLRSLVALDNLVDLIVTCISHPAASNQTFLVSDGEDLSVTDLLTRLGVALGKPARLLPVPVWLINRTASLLGKDSVAQRLCGSLQVDIAHTCETLNWRPPVSVDQALIKTAEAYLKEGR